MTNVYSRLDYSLWPEFNGVEESMLNNIVLLHIFGSLGESAIFVTEDDQVYAIGENVLGFLGIGEIERTHTPIRLDLLCGKYVMGFCSGTTHTIAYTREGELYSWGDNNLGKLGNGTIICRDTPGRVLLPEGAKVIQAACGDRYTVAITSEYKLIHWGDVDWSSSAAQTLPSYIELPEGLLIQSLCCGAFHAAALSTKGEVYTWGCGEMGQLGHRRKPDDVEMIPRLVQSLLAGEKVKEIACSLLATVALTEDGRVFAWGYNTDGALGLGIDMDTIPAPQHVKINEAIQSVGSCNMGGIFVAASQHCVYKWGMQQGVKATNNIPQVVLVSNVLNAYAHAPIPRQDRINIDNNQDQNISEVDETLSRDIGNALYNNKEYSDLTLRLSDGVIYVHKLILRTFCEHFKSMLDGCWAENGKKEIDLTRYNPNAYRAFVKYIYTGKLERSLNGQQLIELCDIAESYVENDLKEMVVAKFPKCLNIENAAELYSAAYSKPCEEIKELCCYFVSRNLEEVILTDAFDDLKGDLCKSLIRRAVEIKRMNRALGQ